jgi:hypothetical protein
MLSVTTNEIAECRVDAAGRAYPEMTLYFSTTNGLTHTFNFSGNLPGHDYLLYVGCSDLAGNVNNTTITVNVPAAPSTNNSVSLSIAPWYPQGNNYIFVCAAQGFTPTSYDWSFGDGQTMYNYGQNNVYHTYPGSGTYNVQCTAKGTQAKSASLQISIGTGGGGDPINTTNATNQTNSTQTCYSTVKDAPASCTGGTVTQDTLDGCRHVTCTSGTSNLQVMACNKPGEYNPQYFEMYKQSQNGTAVSKVCLGSTCISDNGYAKSGGFPICS